MGARRAHAIDRLAGLDHHHWLAGTPARRRSADEAGGVPQSLDIDAQRVGAGIVDEIFQEVADLQVRLVAERYAGAESDAFRHRPIEQRHHQRTALADQADAAVQQLAAVEHDGGTEREPPSRIDQPHAVRPDDPHAGRQRDVENALLQCGAGFIGFGKSGRDDHAATDTGGGALLDRPQQMVHRDREYRDVRLDRRIGK